MWMWVDLPPWTYMNFLNVSPVKYRLWTVIQEWSQSWQSLSIILWMQNWGPSRLFCITVCNIWTSECWWALYVLRKKSIYCLYIKSGIWTKPCRTPVLLSKVVLLLSKQSNFWFSISGYSNYLVTNKSTLETTNVLKTHSKHPGPHRIFVRNFFFYMENVKISWFVTIDPAVFENLAPS